MADVNFITSLTGILGWFVVALFAYRIYKKQSAKPKIWLAVFIIVIGVFSFDFNWEVNNTVLRIPILPLGVWLILFIFFIRTKEQGWKIYRQFAWLGFFANFIFLAISLIAIPMNSWLYPADKVSTYLANVDEASIIQTHPSGQQAALEHKKLKELLVTFEKQRIYSDDWYRETYEQPSSDQIEERFPYQLINYSSKWGSGQSAIIYVEDNGKGILIATPNNQVYFQTQDSFIQQGGK